MTSLGESVPPFKRGTDVAVTVGLTAAAVVPLVGSAATVLAQGLLAVRSESRQHAFNALVANAVEALAHTVRGLSVAGIADSDEFMAAYEKGSRAAAETSSHEKRARLARAVSHVGPWSSLSETLRQQYLDYVVRYDDLHVAVVAYFRDPEAWLARNVTRWTPGDGIAGGPLWPLEQYMLPGDRDSLSALASVVATLRADGLIDLSDDLPRSAAETVAKRSTAIGDGLLRFIEASPSSP